MRDALLFPFRALGAAALCALWMLRMAFDRRLREEIALEEGGKDGPEARRLAARYGSY